jgi:2-polyprenyl-6-methoxyphenol hydroxylase-like FAD-dependent oxidoreductase
MNTGLSDAVNSDWKLAQALQGDDINLETYDLEI